jgi:multidrug resistance protein
MPSPPQQSISLSPPILYTTFTTRQKHFITVLLGYSTLASPLTATIYLPLIPLLSVHFHTSTQAINLTITLYIIFQALAPAIFATISDSLGRRPIYLITFLLYVLASLGLSLNKDSYAALLVLRALQSLGASAILALGYGVVADVSIPAERGRMLGPMMAAANLGPCIGPVVGGSVALRSGGFEWVFWFLVVFGGSTFVAIGLFFPETGRMVVGNGSVPARGWDRTWWTVLMSWGRRRGTSVEEGEVARFGGEELMGSNGRGRKARFKLSNPLACLRIVLWKDAALALWICASFYMFWYCIQASIPSIYKDIYGFNELEIGLAYLTGGAGVILGGFATGKMMDKNYNSIARKTGHGIDRCSGTVLMDFPIERARARGSWYLLMIFVIAMAGYGWAVEAQAHASVPLIIQCVIGFICTCFLQTFSALLVDIFPESPSTAAASGNLTRCALSAIAVAVLQPLLDALGRGWYFTLLSVVGGVGGAGAVWTLQTFGMKWRGQRMLRNSKVRSKSDSGEDGLASMQPTDKVKEKTSPSQLQVAEDNPKDDSKT